MFISPSSVPSAESCCEFGLPAITCTVDRQRLKEGGAGYCLHAERTFLVGVDAVVRVQLLMSLLFANGLTKYRVPVHDVDWFLLARAPRSAARHCFVA